MSERWLIPSLFVSFLCITSTTMKVIFAFVILILTIESSNAQSPEFSGTWILNFEKSTLEQKSESLTSSIFIIDQKENAFYLTRYHIYGSKKNKIHFKMIPDGKTRTIKLLFRGKLVKQENGLMAVLWRNNFLNIVNYHFGVDSNTLVADEIFMGNPQNHHNIWVFDREISPALK